MKKVIASLVLGLVASVSFAAAPVAPAAASAPVVKAEEAKPAVKAPVKKEAAKAKHKTHKVAKPAVKASAPVAPATK